MYKALFAGFAALIIGPAAQGQINPAALKWGPAPGGLPKGARLAVLSGNPNKEGMFTIRLRFPAGYAVKPHWHPADELVTVMAGQMSLGMGSRYVPAKAKALVTGGYVVAPAKMHHYAFTRTGATIQITSHGPFAINYVNPRDDPRRKR